MIRNQPDRDDAIFNRLAEQILARLEHGRCEHCGRNSASAQEMEVARKFLADNSITSQSRKGTPLHSIAERLPYSSENDPESRIERRVG